MSWADVEEWADTFECVGEDGVSSRACLFQKGEYAVMTNGLGILPLTSPPIRYWPSDGGNVGAMGARGAIMVIKINLRSHVRGALAPGV